MIDEIVCEDVKHVCLKFEPELFKGSKFLITGGAGFIGSWLCDIIISLGGTVTCIDNLSSGRINNIDHLRESLRFKFIKEDVSRPSALDGNYDFILHLASRAAPEEYQRHPIETLLANSLGSLNTLELARRCDATILFSSTSEIYGDAEIIPTPETYWGNVNPIGVRSCYDEAKRFGEALFMAYYRQYGLDVRIVRIFNTYGPRMRGDGPYGRVIPKFIMQALRGQDITVYGDGTQTRSFCYITDTTTAMILTLIRDKARGEVINVGNPEEIMIIELARTIKKLTGSPSKITFHPLPPDDPKRRRPDITKAKKILGWEPEIKVKYGLARTIDWFKNVIF